MMAFSPKKKALTNGFSLVEMLVVIAVIGVLTAMAIVVYAGVRDRAVSNVNARNAKAVSLIGMAAMGAGSLEFDGLTTKDEVVSKILDGVLIPGTNGTSSFASPGIDPADKANFIGQLEWDGAARTLVMTP